MLADAAAALFGAGLGAPEYVLPFMEIFLDENEKEGRGSRSYTFLPADRVLARLSWHLLRPYVPRLLAAADWNRFIPLTWYCDTREAQQVKSWLFCMHTTLILAPHFDKILLVQENERVESLNEIKSASFGERLLLLIMGFFEKHRQYEQFADQQQHSEGAVQLLETLLTLPRGLLLQHVPAILMHMLGNKNQLFLVSIKQDARVVAALTGIF